MAAVDPHRGERALEFFVALHWTVNPSHYATPSTGMGDNPTMGNYDSTIGRALSSRSGMVNAAPHSLPPFTPYFDKCGGKCQPAPYCFFFCSYCFSKRVCLTGKSDFVLDEGATASAADSEGFLDAKMLFTFWATDCFWVAGEDIVVKLVEDDEDVLGVGMVVVLVAI